MDSELLGRLTAVRMVLAGLVAKEGRSQLVVESIRDARLREVELIQVSPGQTRTAVIAAAQKELQQIYGTALNAMNLINSR